jgi:hypothetical protein
MRWWRGGCAFGIMEIPFCWRPLAQALTLWLPTAKTSDTPVMCRNLWGMSSHSDLDHSDVCALRSTPSAGPFHRVMPRAHSSYAVLCVGVGCAGVCTSGRAEDLSVSDGLARSVIQRLRKDAPPRVEAQYRDNELWIERAGENKLVVGSQARILYSDARGRAEIARAFNDAIASGAISGPIVLSRDHHDVSGTDSPYRETSNVTDGSMFCAGTDHTLSTLSFRLCVGFPPNLLPVLCPASAVLCCVVRCCGVCFQTWRFRT